jgi:hypothetical protein
MEKKAHIEYLLSEAGRKASLLAGGNGQEHQVIEAELTPEILEVATVNEEGEVSLLVGFDYLYKREKEKYIDVITKYEFSPGYRITTHKTIHRFDTVQTAESLVAWEQQRKAIASASKKECEKKEAIYEKEKKEKDAIHRKARIEKEKKCRKEKAERDRLIAEEKARTEAEKKKWINEHGSDYLRRATVLGYNCQRQYVTERAALEHPDYVVDFDDLASWESRSCPSVEALTEVEELIKKGIEAQVVWLTHPARELDPYDNYEDEYWEPQEAIAIIDYLKRYDLIKEV